jgi:hypothetical protein
MENLFLINSYPRNIPANIFSAGTAIALLVFFSVIRPAPVSAEDTSSYSDAPAPSDAPEAAADDAKTVYYIRDIAFDRTGRTRPFALMYRGEFKIGERITGRENLEKYRQEKYQLLYNQRVLDSVEVRYTLGEADADGSVPVDLLVITKDSWNVIALPRPLYDENIGFDLTIKARDYNFLGTMNALRLDFGYLLDTKNISNYNFEIDSNTPFRALGYDWNLDFDHAFSYVHSDESGSPHFYYKNTTGVSMEIPYDPTTLTFGYEEKFIFGEENSDRYKEEYGYYFEDAWYMSSRLYASWEIPTGFRVGKFGELNYTPELSGNINYRPGGDIGYLRAGPSVNFNHSLSFGQIDWATNFRKGLNVSARNGNGYNFYKNSWDETLSLSATGHLPVTPFLGVSGRFQYRHWFNDYYDTAGDALRGIIDNTLCATYMWSLNLELPFKVFVFVPSVWLNNSKLRFFDFEFHLSPFIDIALLKDPVNGISFSPKEIQASAGLELIVFSYFMRSLYFRVSLGYNLREAVKGNFSGKNSREIFVGLGHYY